MIVLSGIGDLRHKLKIRSEIQKKTCIGLQSFSWRFM